MNRKHYCAWAAAVLALIATARIVAAYGNTSQGFDEPAHIACGMEWLDRGSYILDPLHPPLARIAIGLSLFLARERLPPLTPSNTGSVSEFWVVGNSVLYDSGHYLRNLALARAGVLPFFLLGALVVFVWARREYGDCAAITAVALLTTTPIVLAFSGLAYTDLPAASTQLLALFAWTLWLKAPTTRSTLFMGIAVGLALLSKFTSLLFLPAAAVAVLLCKWLLPGDVEPPLRQTGTRWIRNFGLATAIAMTVLWGGYRFSVGHVQEDMRLSPQSMPTFQHFPRPVQYVARAAVLRDAWVPAPSLLLGIADAWAANEDRSEAYLLGKTKRGGWWYFFLIGILVKTPIPLLILSVLGFCCLFRPAGHRQWERFAPGVCALAILLVTMGVKRDAGLRHILVVYPLLTIVAGFGGSVLWKLEGRWRVVSRWTLAALLAWQGVATIRAWNDSIAYFNEFAEGDPSRILVTGCDLDCGQDIFRLSQELHARHVAKVSLAVWSSADLARMGLPDYEILQPFQPATGWVAISVRSLLLGDVAHTTYPPGSFAWLGGYQPVAQVGKTIRLYYIPEN